MIASYKKNLFKDFSSWFTELADLAQNTEDNSSLPKLELLLHTGNTLRGSIIHSRKTANEHLLMILGIPDSYSKSEITLVSSSQVVALTLVEPSHYLKFFAAPENTAIVGSLELKRAIKNSETELEKIIGEKTQLLLDVDSFPESSRGDVLRAIGYLPIIFETLTADELGKKLVQNAIKNIQITIGTTNTTILNEQTLLLEILSPLSILESKEKERIKTAIENLL
ncbi:hypothetical protein CLU83_1907 [Flavobacterium sp. 1]|uniref:hypothetical protein n=1 Tax=Flavobacterium sp. 1 TaxID=2035200 RepID=UPI000C238680|nr:hypothetical protein [Flavobacterium sp. 1]PJJ08621.1 hypothetical protein CLU83_1907 [Flavobacterium sp. 1]